MIPDLVAEEFDAILAGMSITAKREQTIDFTEAYYPPTPSIYIAKAGEGDEAAQGTIGATANTIYSDYFTGMGVPFVSLDGSIDAASAVLNDEVDAVLVDHGYGVEKLAAYPGQLEIVGPSVLLDRGLGIGVRKNTGLKSKLDQALASMKSDGTLNALILQWLGEDASTFPIAPPPGSLSGVGDALEQIWRGASDAWNVATDQFVSRWSRAKRKGVAI